MRVALAFLLFFHSLHAFSNASINGIVDPSPKFKTPLARNIDSSTLPQLSKSMSSRCQQLSSAINQSTTDPTHIGRVETGYDSNGKPRHEMREYDKRRDLELEFMQANCR